MSEVKRIDIKEFREKGYLQELNRQFLHPLGLALEIIIDGESEKLGGIWDYRDDPEGIHFVNKTSNGTNFKIKADFVKSVFDTKKVLREKKLGYVIQPVGDK